MKIIKKTKAGLTLIELIVSIAIIGMIVVAFMPLFVMSSKTNNRSETILDSTYLGKDVMELVYNLSKTVPYNELKNKLVSEKGYTELSSNTYLYEYEDKKCLYISFTESENLIKVVTKIYKDKSMNQLEVQYESLYSWIGRGILSEE
ncbi:type II secretion system protein [Alkaliphilus oremlandii]|uniref:Prepilin-type N-terminal cleavage/methylation domain-containing protein n=1 Tax=Alkaliphilus oremlandii (strain OhILAs) TaxID=350688 RepID=A8MLZ8_ALKOO|nr:type II secretion system protein [Alkaliphilus oremlandii]ABW18165.1 hypothetical protein Clos_0605 [Alkaliphilus oremlandii OhILAs]